MHHPKEQETKIILQEKRIFKKAGTQELCLPRIKTQNFLEGGYANQPEKKESGFALLICKK